MSNNYLPVLTEHIARKIFLIRNRKVLLDEDLAVLYQVETKQLTRQVRRNRQRFPRDFTFRLTKEEASNLRCQNGTSNRGGRRYLAYAFTEQGVAMLSSVLNSDRAIQVNIQIMRTFSRLREILMSHAELKEKIEKIESKYDEKFKLVFDAIKQLITTEETPQEQIGFRAK